MTDDQAVSPAVAARLRVQWANHLLDTRPLDPKLWFDKALYFDQAMTDVIPHRTRLERVLLWYEQGFRGEPDNWACRHNCALVLSELHRYEEALAFSREAARLKPGNPHVQTLLIQTLDRLGLHGQAAEAAAAAIRHGCDIDPELINRPQEPMRTDRPDVGDVYWDRESASAALRRGEVSRLIDASDPELHTLQVEVGELADLGLAAAADDLCIQFELSHGITALTRSMLTWARSVLTLRGGDENGALPVTVSAAYPLLELTFCLPFDRVRAVEQIFSGDGPGAAITPRDLDDFDDHIRWHISNLGDVRFDITDPLSVIRPVPEPLARTQAMAMVNFIVARRMDMPVLVAYTATTLAELYNRMGLPNLPFILYAIAAKAAEQAGQANYAVNAHGKCAELLKARGQLGGAIRHLESARSYQDKVVPQNRCSPLPDGASSWS